MPIQHGYNCPKCSWGLRERLEENKYYTCPICKTELLVKLDKKRNKFILFDSSYNQKNEPIGLPKGSVRAIILVILSIALWYLIFSGQDAPSYILNLMLIIIGYYFAFRGTNNKYSSHFFDSIQDRKQPLYLPEGWIRAFIVVGFTACLIYLLNINRFQDFKYIEFFFILFGLVLGNILFKVTSSYHDDKWYIMLNHLKGIVVLIFTIILFFQLVVNELIEIDITLVRLIIGIIGFYFGSR